MDNAVRFTEKLRKQDVNAYHFLHHSGLYKVRFGNFSSKKAAVDRAKALYSEGIINNFYIVAPKNYSSADLSDKINTNGRQLHRRTLQVGWRVSGRGV